MKGLSLDAKLENNDLTKFIDSHSVVYIRHLLWSSEEIYGNLMSKHIAAIHYAELKQGVKKTKLENYLELANYNLIENDDIKDAKLAVQAISRLKHYAEVGAVVVADYTDSEYAGKGKRNPKTISLGILHKGTSIKPIVYPEFTYRQVELDHAIDLGQTDFASILAVHPRGSTVVHWEEGQKAIRFIYKLELGLLSTLSEVTFEVLFPAQQEVLCSEYSARAKVGFIKN
jgi:hypothetical protein